MVYPWGRRSASRGSAAVLPQRRWPPRWYQYPPNRPRPFRLALRHLQPSTSPRRTGIAHPCGNASYRAHAHTTTIVRTCCPVRTGNRPPLRAESDKSDKNVRNSWFESIPVQACIPCIKGLEIGDGHRRYRRGSSDRPWWVNVRPDASDAHHQECAYKNGCVLPFSHRLRHGQRARLCSPCRPPPTPERPPLAPRRLYTGQTLPAGTQPLRIHRSVLGILDLPGWPPSARRRRESAKATSRVYGGSM